MTIRVGVRAEWLLVHRMEAEGEPAESWVTHVLSRENSAP